MPHRDPTLGPNATRGSQSTRGSVPAPPREPTAPMALAMHWVGRVFGVVSAMVLPAWGGAWLDERVGTRLFALLGVVLGLVAGMAYLLVMTRSGVDVRRRHGEPARRSHKGQAEDR